MDLSHDSSDYDVSASFSELSGRLLVRVEGGAGDESIAFVTSDGERWLMLHDQDCCEHVFVEDVCGDTADLIGSPLLLAEETSRSAGADDDVGDDSGTWTFYKMATIKGSVTIRWLGTSSGYYSESVSFYRARHALSSHETLESAFPAS